MVYALVAVAVVGFAFSNGWFQDDKDAAGQGTTTTVPSTTTTVPTEVPPIQWLASPRGEIPKYDAPGGTEIGVTGQWYGYPMTMPILERQGDWLLVMTPERPNGSSAWIRADQADVSSTAYRIVIRLAETKVIVYKDGYRLHEMPAGLGKASTPTPAGHSFVAVKEIPGPHGYGPVVLDLSAHSEAIQSWQGAGDAIIALHGPISVVVRRQDRHHRHLHLQRLRPPPRSRPSEARRGPPRHPRRHRLIRESIGPVDGRRSHQVRHAGLIDSPASSPDRLTRVSTRLPEDRMDAC